MLWPIPSSTLKTMILTISLLALLISGVKLYSMGKEAGTLQGELAKRQAEVATLTTAIEAHKELNRLQEEALKSDQIAASEAYARLSLLNDEVSSLEDYISTLEDGSSVCLDSTDTGRVRDLLKAPNGAGTGSPKAPSNPR